MAERALVTPRRLGPGPTTTLGSAADGVAPDDADRFSQLGLRVERRLSHGMIVSREGERGGGDAPWREVEAMGFRVKLLPDDSSLEVGEYRIEVKSGDTPEVPPELSVPDELRESWPHHLVQLDGSPTAERVARIEAYGVEVVEPISDHALFVYAPPERVARLRGPGGLGVPDGFVVWTGPFLPAYRIALELLNAPGGVECVNVGVYPAEQGGAVAAAIGEAGGQVLRQWERTGSYRHRLAFLVALVDADAIPRVARIPWVRSLYRQATSMQPDDERSVQIVVPRLDGKPPPHTGPVRAYSDALAQLGLDGSGVVIGFCDTGVDTNDTCSNGTLHGDLRGRMVFFEDVTSRSVLVDLHGHGTHVAGIAVGSGASGAAEADGWVLGQGVAPAASFGCVNAVDNLKQPILGPGTVPGGPGLEPFARYTRLMVSNGVHVMNNSWGQDPSVGYTANAAMVDRLARDPNADDLADPSTDYLVLVFSAGNKGPDPRTICEPKEAKNVIVVGGSLNGRNDADIRGVAETSSRGPARDGRLLPTVVAPGDEIVSARSTVEVSPGVRAKPPFRESRLTEGGEVEEVIHHDHSVQSGTSQAAPHVAGLCALLIQWWGRRFPGARPSSAMLKALLVNGAEDLADGPDGRPQGTLAHVPSCDQGWGRVCLASMVAREPKVLHDQAPPLTAPGEEHRRIVEIADPARQLRVTLAWTDPPGTPGAARALINDLDLEVIELASGRVFKGNVFRDGVSVPDAGDADALNNLECVYVDRPAGRYAVIVIASKLVSEALPPFRIGEWQDYALVVDNAVEIGTAVVEQPPVFT